MSKQKYEAMREKLNADMLSAKDLATKPENQGFVNRNFMAINKAKQEKQITHGEYIQLINRLSAFRQGEYNDYIDMLLGAAHMGMLAMAIQGEIPQFSPDQARQRRDIVTDMSGVQPIQPDEGASE